MAESMIALGDFVFGIDTAAFQTLQRTTNWRWASIERTGGATSRQFVGKGDDRITLPGVIYTVFKGGVGQIDAMRAEAARGTPLVMIDYQGNIRGLWVIEAVHEVQSYFLPGGAPKKMEFSLELAAYGEDFTNG